MPCMNTCAARLCVLLKLAFADPSIDRRAVTAAAVALMEAAALAEDDDVLTELADSLAEEAVLWACPSMDRQDIMVLNSLRSYELASAAIAADML